MLIKNSQIRPQICSHLLGEADGHALEDGVQGEGEYYEEAAQGHLEHNRIDNYRWSAKLWRGQTQMNALL